MVGEFKPTKYSALLMQEAIRAKMSGPVSGPERVELERLDSELDAYLKNN
jgi:hypothetical protein